jgi:N-methylhydantoinase B
MLDDCWLTCGIERSQNNPWGLLGGGEARPNRASIRYADGSREALIKATGAKVPKGSTFELSTGGGGGYGPPDERDPEAIAADVRAGYISEEYAREHYPQYRPSDT